MIHFVQSIQNLIVQMPAWLYAVLIFSIWYLGATAVKRFFFKRMRKAAEKTETLWDDILLRSLRQPITLIIIGIGINLIRISVHLSEQDSKTVFIVFQGSLVLAIILFFDRLVREVGKIHGHRKKFSLLSQGIFQGFVRGIIIGLGLLVFADMFGISITPILASLGIGSLAVALGLQETLANFFAGIYITIDQPIRIGDFVKLETGDEGYVMEIGWRSTRIRLLPNNMVIVPNQKLMSSVITNYYLPDKEIAVLINVGVHYQSDLKKVEAVTIDVAKEILKSVPGGVATFEPFIRYHTFDQSSINFTVILRGKEFTDQYLIKHEFVKALHERYKKEGIVIPYPMRTIEISQNTLATLTRPNKS